MSDLFVADDANGEPTIWRWRLSGALRADAVARRCELHPELWDRLVNGGQPLPQHE